MKKQYEKPQIIFDSFELSQSIAAGCEFIANHEWAKCAVDDGLQMLFTMDTAACESVPGPGPFDSVCYDIPNPSNNVFSS